MFPARDIIDLLQARASSGHAAFRIADRAAVVTTAIMQMIATASKNELRQAIEAYLREEFEDATRQLAAEGTEVVERKR